MNFHRTHVERLLKHIFLAFFSQPHVWKGTRKLCVDKKKIQVTAKLLVHIQHGNMTFIIILFFMTSGKCNLHLFFKNHHPKYPDKVWFPSLEHPTQEIFESWNYTSQPNLW